MNNTAGIIYKATNMINGKSYIGQTVQILSNRISKHYKSISNHASYKFCRALRKYDKNVWMWEILYENVPKSLLGKTERFAIGNYDTKDNGYNSTYGGEDNPMNYPEYRLKVSLALKGRPGRHNQVTEETKRKISEANTGKKRTEQHCIKQSKRLMGKYAGVTNPFYGKKHTAETIAKMSGNNNPMYGKTGDKSSFWGRHHTDDTKKKLSLKNRGRRHTEEEKQKMRDSSRHLSGIDHAMYGKHHTEESKRNMSLDRQGEKHPNSKLTDQQVTEIRNAFNTSEAEYKSDFINKMISVYNVSYGCLSKILRGETYKHLLENTNDNEHIGRYDAGPENNGDQQRTSVADNAKNTKR
jgi:group I intron endonuclease